MLGSVLSLHKGKSQGNQGMLAESELHQAVKHLGYDKHEITGSEIHLKPGHIHKMGLSTGVTDGNLFCSPVRFMLFD